MPRWLDWLLGLFRRPVAPAVPIPPRPTAPQRPALTPEERRALGHTFMDDWALTPITVEDAEARHPGMAADDPRLAKNPEAAKPFGFMSPGWDELKAKMQPGDELYEYMSDPESWRHLAGRSGYVLVRAGKPIADIVTMMN